jgi:cyclophilin family peptidyl-prolyl cis-trans isomerase
MHISYSRPTLAVLATVVAGCFFATFAEAKIARFNTSAGLIDVRMYDGIAPMSVANFSNYVTSFRYNTTFIHRVPQLPPEQGGGTADFVVQGGGFRMTAANSIYQAVGIVTDAPIGDEYRGISNTEGTIAFAKNQLGATSQFFFNIDDNSFLNAQGFTVFGRVVQFWDTVLEINDLATVDYSDAENGPGEDYDEIPVHDKAKVDLQGDITKSDAVMVNSVSFRNLPAGDYNFDTTVDFKDFNLWKLDFGSTTLAAADGNGNGVVDAADFAVWRDTYGQTTGGVGAVLGIAPEPGTGILLLFAAPAVAWRRRTATHALSA